MKTRTLFVAAVLLAAAFAGQAFSSTVAVGNCTKFLSYPTIQLAVTNAPAGSTVKVCPGTYPEQVTITKNLKVIGNGPTASTVVVPAGGLVTNGVLDIFGNATAAQIFVKNATVTISNLAVDGANDGMTDCSIDPIGIYFQNASGTITNNAVRNVLLPPALQGCQVGLAINVESNVGIPQVTISNNSIRNYDKNGITVEPSHWRERTQRHHQREHRDRSGRYDCHRAKRDSSKLWRERRNKRQFCDRRYL